MLEAAHQSPGDPEPPLAIALALGSCGGSGGAELELRAIVIHRPIVARRDDTSSLDTELEPDGGGRHERGIVPR